MGWMGVVVVTFVAVAVASTLVMVPLLFARQRLEEEVYEGLVRRGMPANDIPELLYGPGFTGFRWSDQWRQERPKLLRIAAEVAPESRYARIEQREDVYQRNGVLAGLILGLATSWVLDRMV